MRWIFVRNAVNFAVNFCKQCGEMWWIIFFHRIHRFHRTSYINLPQKSMRWIFVRNAVKCGEIFNFTAFTAITAFLTKIHRIHRISYKIYPKTSTRVSLNWYQANLMIITLKNSNFFKYMQRSSNFFASFAICPTFHQDPGVLGHNACHR